MIDFLLDYKEIILSVIIIPCFLWLFNFINTKCKEGMIIRCLNQSFLEQQIGKRKKGRYRTTHAISAALDIDENTIQKICSNSKYIRRNREEKESWTLRKYAIKDY